VAAGQPTRNFAIAERSISIPTGAGRDLDAACLLRYRLSQNRHPHRMLGLSFTSSSSYKPMLYLALARLPFSFRTFNLKTGVQRTPEYLAVNRWGVVPSPRHHA
jgi:hypothetical protein